MSIRPSGRRPARRSVLPRGLLVVVLTAALGQAGCGATATSTPVGGSPSPTTGPSTDGSAIDHATGATDVVFRFEEGGGFVPMDVFTTAAPQFTLYGDGTVIFRDNNASGPSNPNPNIIIQAPFQTVRIDEAAMQAFLRFALADSGLGVARASYRAGNVADAPTAIFTIHAGGLDKTVSVEALGMETQPGPDSALLKALAGLGERLRAYSPFAEGETAWTPTRWRGVLTQDQVGPQIPWPWPDIVPADFAVRAGNNALQFPIRTMTPAEVSALDLANIEGGLSGLGLTGPDGKAYRFSLRPLLPDESF